MTLRDYQQRAVAEVRQAHSEGHRPILYSPTGSGKTEMGMDLIRGNRALFVVNRIQLVQQASERFQTAGIEHGVIQGANSFNAYADVIVASIQTLMRREEWAAHLLKRSDLIVVDEAHAVPGSALYRKMFAMTDKPMVGLSATPFSTGLGKYFDRLIVAATIKELIQQGHLVDVEIFAPPDKPDLANVPMVAGDYKEDALADEMNRTVLVGNILSHWLKLAEGKPTIFFGVNIAHSKNVCARFMQAGIPAAHIDCNTPDEERKRIIKDFRDLRIRVLCNCAVLAEGFDCPAAEVMILGRPTTSLSRFVQMAGRILRPYYGKNRALILDHSDTVRRLGFPTDDLPLQLSMGKEAKSTKTEKKKPAEAAIECLKCGLIRPYKTLRCENCGHISVPKADVDYTEDALEQLRRTRPPPTADNVKIVYAQMLGYVESKGWKKGAAFFKTAEYFKLDPKVAGGFLKGYHPPPAPPTPVVLNWLKSRQIAYGKASLARSKNTNERPVGATA